MIESFTDRRIDLYPNEPLQRDLTRLRVEEKSYGYRLTSPRDEHGHGDLASAFSFALLIAHGEAGEIANVVGVGAKGEKTTTLEGMASEFEQRQRAFDARQQQYQPPDDILGNDDYEREYNNLFRR
ncbi:MAG: hypothetical protein IID44_09870 [Planctomycetes bacterium]|nr:hypothetical protein [Planctomycetota bacterium]